jgi:hypothetical protein
MTRSASTAREVVINVTALLVIGSIHSFQIALTLRARDYALLAFQRPRRARSGQCYLSSLGGGSVCGTSFMVTQLPIENRC